MKYLFLILTLLVSCTSLNMIDGVRGVSLTRFPDVKTDYNYNIKLSHDVKSVVIFWYYTYEERSSMIYSSGVVPIKHGTIETQMYFPWEGEYIMVILTQTSDTRTHQKHRYRFRTGFKL